jgi:hypothetical protein
VLHQLPQLLQLRHLLLLVSEPRLLQGLLRVQGVLRRGVPRLLPRMARVGLLPWLRKLLRRTVLLLPVSRLGVQVVLRRGETRLDV